MAQFGAMTPEDGANNSDLAAPGSTADAIELWKKPNTTSLAGLRERLAPLLARMQRLPTRGIPVLRPTFRHHTVVKAPADACFKQIGEFNTPKPDAQGNCPAGYKPKVNATYIIGHGNTDDHQWTYFGTANGGQCEYPVLAGLVPDTITPFVTDHMVCENGSSQNAITKQLAAVYGDMSVDHLWRFNAFNHKLEDVTPPPGDGPGQSKLFQNILTMRGGAQHNGVVFLAGSQNGPNFRKAWGPVTIFAWEANTARFLGETELPGATSIRNGSVIDGQLYFGVRFPTPGRNGGSILKWVGNVNDPFKFEVVAKDLEFDPAYMNSFDHHIMVGGYTTAVAAIGGANATKMYMSPKIPPGGLTEATNDPSNWKSVFSMDQYDPDPVISKTINFGDAREFDGKFIFSTYEMGGMSSQVTFTKYGLPSDDVTKLLWMLNAERKSAEFVMDHPGQPNQTVRLLYGQEKIPVFNPETRQWVQTPNKLGQKPKYGPGGFGNPFIYYNWIWQEYKGRLYQSQLDVSSGVDPGPAAMVQVFGFKPETAELARPVLEALYHTTGGGDVYYWTDLNRPAYAENRNGWGNHNAIGTRVWNAVPERDKMYAGSIALDDLRPVGTNRNPGGWQIDELDEIGGPDDLHVTISVPATVIVNHNVTIRVRIKNVAATIAANTRVCVRLPRGFKLVSGAGVTEVKRQACFTPEPIAPGATVTRELTATAPATAETAAVAATAKGRQPSPAGAVRGADAARVAVRAAQGGGVTG